MTEIDLDKIADKCFPEAYWSTMPIPKGFRTMVRHDIKSALLKVANATREETIRKCIQIFLNYGDENAPYYESHGRVTSAMEKLLPSNQETNGKDK